MQLVHRYSYIRIFLLSGLKYVYIGILDLFIRLIVNLNNGNRSANTAFHYIIIEQIKVNCEATVKMQ